MNTETTTATEETEQLNAIGDIFANMLADAETMIERQRRVLQQQMDDLTTHTGNLIKDSMLSICASAGIQASALKAVIASKKAMLDTNGHTDETEGGSQD